MTVSTQQSDASTEATPRPDEYLVKKILAGNDDAFAVLMRRHNQRLYRLIRGITKDPVSAEDVLQQTYVSAYRHLAQFEGRAQFGTWLTRIAVNEALRSRRGAARVIHLEEHVARSRISEQTRSPEHQTAARQWTQLLEHAIDRLAEDYRAVVLLRLVERLDTEETADILGISTQNVRVRLHRARLQIRDDLFREVGDAIDEVYEFGGQRCDRTVRMVMDRLFL